jgi:hypothetical protein
MSLLSELVDVGGAGSAVGGGRSRGRRSAAATYPGGKQKSVSRVPDLGRRRRQEEEDYYSSEEEGCYFDDRLRRSQRGGRIHCCCLRLITVVKNLFCAQFVVRDKEAAGIFVSDS